MNAVRRPAILLLSLLSLCVTSAAAPDPFAPARPDWVETLRAERPFTLQVLTLEVDAGKQDQFVRGSDQGWVVTPEFLAAAQRIDIATSGADSGFAAIPGAFSVGYRLAPLSRGHALDIRLRVLSAEAKAEVDSKLTIDENWIVLGGLTREQTTVLPGTTVSVKRNRVIALRLVREVIAD